LGLLLAKSGMSDVVDAHVALLARRLHATVLTSDPDDLTALDPTLTLVTVSTLFFLPGRSRRAGRACWMRSAGWCGRSPRRALPQGV
jgi:hypothetical protein